MKPLAFLACVATLAFAPIAARACGHCLEDKVAAVYDWNTCARAAGQRHVVVYASVDGKAREPETAFTARLRHAVTGAKGIDSGSVRVSASPAAVAFACAPQRRAGALAEMNRALAGAGLRLVEISIPGVRRAS